MRYGLKAALDGSPAVRDVREVPARAALDPRGLAHLDVVIVSYADWDVARTVVGVARDANVRVLAFVDDDSVKDTEKLLAIRPDGYLLESGLTRHALEDALVRTVRNEMPMPSTILSQVFDSATRNLRNSHPRFVELTSREQEALELLADGLSNKEIAQRLYISVHGAKRLVGNILLKLNSPNRTQAVVLAMRNGLLHDPA
ncbi:helix-turn-helix domain-containing protein [Sphaerisporangium sp. NPDC004334]